MKKSKSQKHFKIVFYKKYNQNIKTLRFTTFYSLRCSMHILQMNGLRRKGRCYKNKSRYQKEPLKKLYHYYFSFAEKTYFPCFFERNIRNNFFNGS